MGFFNASLVPKVFPLQKTASMSSPPGERRRGKRSSFGSELEVDDAADGDEDTHIEFPAAYHHSYTNVLAHMVFVLPILFTALLLCTYTPAFLPMPLSADSIPGQQFIIFNFSFFVAAFFAFYFYSMDLKSGWLASVLVLCCWPAANALMEHLGPTVAWKVGFGPLMHHLACMLKWTAYPGLTARSPQTVFRNMFVSSCLPVFQCLRGNVHSEQHSLSLLHFPRQGFLHEPPRVRKQWWTILCLSSSDRLCRPRPLSYMFGCLSSELPDVWPDTQRH